MPSKCNNIKIVISQKTERIMKYSPAFVASIVCLPFVILLGGDFLVLIAILVICIFLFALMALIDHVAPAPADKPDLYQINPKTNSLTYKQNLIEPGRTINLSKVYKLTYINHRYNKRLKLYYIKESGAKWVASSNAPAFEKCNAEWRHLFEEIRKRIPEDAKIVISDTNFGRE